MRKRTIEVEDDTAGEIVELQTYLEEKGVKATYDEIVMAAIKLAKRLGADKWSFVCELKKKKEEMKEE